MFKNITLVSMDLTNFKGVRSLHANFGKVTNVFGDNGAGKTTLFDAFSWLLFDKNSANESSFSLKTNDENGNPIHHLEHRVEAKLEINGIELSLSKTLKEKWVKKRGSSLEEFSGHETKYEVNGVPVTMTEYKSRIQELVDEKAFMLLTNPMQFSMAQGWKERREILLKVLGEVSDQDVINSNPEELEMLTSQLEKHSIDDLLKITKQIKSRLNDDMKIIPERIKEVQLSKIDPIPEKELLKEKKKLQDRIFDINQGLKYRTSLDDQRLSIKQWIYTLEGELLKAKRNATERQETAIAGFKKKWLEESLGLGNLKSDLTACESDYSRNKRQLERIQADLSEKLTQYKNQYTTVFNPSDDYTACPTCGRPYDADHIAHTRDSLEAEFNRKKSQVLTEIKSQGDDLRNREKEALAKDELLRSKIDSLMKAIDEAEQTTAEAKKEYEKAKNIEIPQSEDITKVEEEIKKANEEMSTLTDDGADQSLKDDLKNLNAKIEVIDRELAKSGINDRADKRIKELEEELAEKSEEFVRAQQTEFAVEEFMKAKVRLLESRVNQHFTAVRFKLFEQQINGGLSETCEALVNTNGSLVPFKDANHAGKVNAGLDIINTLTEYYQTSAPIWIDSRGEVNRLTPTKGQIINLYVSNDKKIRIEQEA